MPLLDTTGNNTEDAYQGGSAVVPNYIEDVFSTWLYTGNGSTQTITNNIDLSGKGGLVWAKDRSSTNYHSLEDTVRGVGIDLSSNSTGANFAGGGITAFNTNGYSIDSFSRWNQNTLNFVNWTFRKQPKFFDIVTYTGTGSAQNISHNLGSVPGCIFVKSTSSTSQWGVYHRSLGNAQWMQLNLTDASSSASASIWNLTDPTSTNFSVGTGYSNVGVTYVAYVFAHNAGGFGLTGTDNVITCGSFTTDSSGNATVNLGYEPQWILTKRSISPGGNWLVIDTMRGLSQTSTANLVPNTSGAETSSAPGSFIPTATGFSINANAQVGGSDTWIYIAIRRGPMKVPTLGTSVFSPNSTSGTTGTQITTNFPIDWQVLGINAGNVYNQRVSTRLTGVNTDGTSTSQYLITSLTNAEAATRSVTLNWGNTGFQVPSLNSGSPIITWNFQRAPSVFDIVCYTGTGANTTQTHNLGVVPELIIVKQRASTTNWLVYSTPTGASNGLFLNLNDSATGSATFWNSTTPTSSVFSLGNSSQVNASGGTFVAYLFATCAGVSKVGSYTGTGATQTINCGFTGGARFVLVKRTDSTGDWYVWDTARGMVSGTDPSLLLDSTAAEVNANSIYTATGGFQIVSTASGINASGGTYIFLAIA